MKKIFVLILIFILLLTLYACNNNGKSIEYKSRVYTHEPIFVCIESGDEYQIVYHRDTKVMYVISENYSSYGPRAIFTVMLDADGKPLLWKGD